jgi:predicted Zn-dependent protease
MEPHYYSLRAIESMLGLSRSVITGLIDAGFVTPTRGPRRTYRFTFQDVVLLRTACGLQQARIPPRRILRSLQKLKSTLPDELPMSGLRITAVGNEIAVREGRTQWHVDSGQLLMDFEVKPVGDTVRVLAPRHARADNAAVWFDRGVALEANDPRGAEAAYRRALQAQPAHVDAGLNLGVLLCDSGRCEDAVAVYDGVLAQRDDVALLHFNRAVALEDLKRTGDALAGYAQCLQLDPEFADAHFNAARLHETLGQQKQAIRHYSAYRRLLRNLR